MSTMLTTTLKPQNTKSTLDKCECTLCDGLLGYLNCPICCNQFTEPVIIRECGHTFCKNCLQSWIRSNSRFPTCPNCRQKLFLKPLYKPNYVLQSVLNHLSYSKNLDNVTTVQVTTSATSLPQVDEYVTSQECPGEESTELRYDITTTRCFVCKALLKDKCTACHRQSFLQTMSDYKTSNCYLAVGKCDHIYHYHCIKSWLQCESTCPLDDYIWTINTKLTNVKVLPVPIILLNNSQGSRVEFELPGNLLVESLQDKVQQILNKKTPIYCQIDIRTNISLYHVHQLFGGKDKPIVLSCSMR